MIKKALCHTKTIMIHKYYVWKAIKDCGRGFREIFHKMSKFSPTEFFESIKYYTGETSPITLAKKDKGYSSAWFHYRGINKHHSQYWCDISFGEVTPCEMQWRYLVELICDGIGAGKAYNGKNWNNSVPLQYFNNVDNQ